MESPRQPPLRQRFERATQKNDDPRPAPPKQAEPDRARAPRGAVPIIAPGGGSVPAQARPAKLQGPSAPSQKSAPPAKMDQKALAAGVRGAKVPEKDRLATHFKAAVRKPSR